MNREDADLTNRHAVVTGAGRGIGSTIAAALTARGAQVTLMGRDPGNLRTVSQALGGESRAAAVTADVSDPASVAAAFHEARQHFGPVHILVNNAGQASSAKFTDTDEALWNRMMAVNLNGTFLCARQAVADMLQVGFGRIVNIASVAGLKGGAYISAYAASKHAVIGLTRSLALELATKNVTVNAVCPGFTDTDIVKESINNIVRKTGRSPAEALESLVAGNPQRRLIKPEEVAHTVAWLCGPGAGSITGQSIVVAGGEVM